MQIAEFLSETSDSSIDKFDVVFMEGNASTGVFDVTVGGERLIAVQRNNCKIDRDMDRLSLGRRGKLGGPNDGLAGIIDFNGKKAEDIVEKAKAEFIKNYELTRGEKFTKGNYSSETWFRFVKDRKPLLIVYFLCVDGEEKQQKQFEELRNELDNTPVVGFALGLPRNDEASRLQATRYRANKIYNWFEKDEMDIGDEE